METTPPHLGRLQLLVPGLDASKVEYNSDATVRVESGPRATDVYGRTLAYLYTKSGKSIDEVLVKEGLAVAWTRNGQHRGFINTKYCLPSWCTVTGNNN